MLKESQCPTGLSAWTLETVFTKTCAFMISFVWGWDLYPPMRKQSQTFRSNQLAMRPCTKFYKIWTMHSSPQSQHASPQCSELGVESLSTPIGSPNHESVLVTQRSAWKFAIYEAKLLNHALLWLARDQWWPTYSFQTCEVSCPGADHSVTSSTLVAAAFLRQSNGSCGYGTPRMVHWASLSHRSMFPISRCFPFSNNSQRVHATSVNVPSVFAHPEVSKPKFLESKVRTNIPILS